MPPSEDGRDDNGRFISITNRDIWLELTALRKTVHEILVSQGETHAELLKDHESRLRKLEVRLPSIIGGGILGVGVVLKLAGVI